MADAAERLGPLLVEREAAGLYRRRPLLESPPGARVVLDGVEYRNFASNDYLGLAAHPEPAAALAEGARTWGAGAGSAHLLGGHAGPHQALEAELAAFVGRERALVFSTGYMANLGVIEALAGRRDTFWEDRLNHASLIDGARLAGARLRRYAHADPADLARRRGDDTALVATDGVFSMDGDLAPLAELVEAAGESWLLVDDAHGLGVVGPGGRGSVAAAGLGTAEVPVLVGTLGKAFGTFGAFVAGDEALIEAMVNTARTFIYTTALPPAVAEATRASLALIRGEEGERRRARLQVLIGRFRERAADAGLTLMDSPTPIQPVPAGEAETASAWADALGERGIRVAAVRPPTVPPGTARLRVSLIADHTEADIDDLVAALAATRPAEVPW
ncbi:MAG: 8-amino-7-oxononanoate synthase [Thiohalospira sp.]